MPVSGSSWDVFSTKRLCAGRLPIELLGKSLELFQNVQLYGIPRSVCYIRCTVFDRTVEETKILYAPRRFRLTLVLVRFSPHDSASHIGNTAVSPMTVMPQNTIDFVYIEWHSPLTMALCWEHLIRENENVYSFGISIHRVRCIPRRRRRSAIGRAHFENRRLHRDHRDVSWNALPHSVYPINGARVCA